MILGRWIASLVFAAIGYLFYDTVGVDSKIHNFGYIYAFTMPLSAFLLGLYLWRLRPSHDKWMGHFGLSFNNVLYLIFFMTFNLALLRMVEQSMFEKPESFSKAVEYLAFSYGTLILVFLQPRVLLTLLVAVLLCTFISQKFNRQVRRFG